MSGWKHGDGWNPWVPAFGYETWADSPYSRDEVKIVRDDWQDPVTVDPNRLHPMMNVIGLYWRPSP